MLTTEGKEHEVKEGYVFVGYGTEEGLETHIAFCEA